MLTIKIILNAPSLRCGFVPDGQRYVAQIMKGDSVHMQTFGSTAEEAESRAKLLLKTHNFRGRIEVEDRTGDCAPLADHDWG